MEVEPDKPVKAEIEVACANVRFVEFPVEHEYHSHRVLRDRIGRVRGYSHDPELPGGFLQRDIVVACAPHRDHLHTDVREGAHSCGSDVVVDERADCAAALGELNGFRAEAAFKIDKLKIPVQLVKVYPVVGFGVEKGDSFHFILSLLRFFELCEYCCRKRAEYAF